MYKQADKSVVVEKVLNENLVERFINKWWDFKHKVFAVSHVEMMANRADENHQSSTARIVQKLALDLCTMELDLITCRASNRLGSVFQAKTRFVSERAARLLAYYFTCRMCNK